MTNFRRTELVNSAFLAACFSFLGYACAPASEDAVSGSGGSAPAAGGVLGGGGVVSTGGVASAAGGVVAATGGVASATGGSGSAVGGASAEVGGSVSVGGTDVGAGGSGGTDVGTGGGSAGEVYNPDFVEFVGEDCDVPEPADKSNDTLADLFEWISGGRMESKAEWKCRRAELKKIVEKYIHGPKPGTPDEVTGTVTASAINVTVNHGGKSTSFSVSISIPSNAPKPAPLLIGLGGVSGGASGVSMAKTVTDEGVATGNYNHTQLASETSRNGKFTDIYGTGTGASAQIAWAWGISRVLDVLVAEKEAGRNDIIDPTAVGITGCSRNGKGAFTIGAFDERIALGIPQESGTGGVTAFRIVNTQPVGPNGKPAQSLASAWSEAQGWFGTVFQKYTSGTAVNAVPGDTHSLVAMYAPRGLLVLDNSRIGELGSPGQHAASAAGMLVYRALGVEKNITYHGGNPSDPHNHCSFYESQVEPLQKAIRAHLTRTAPADGAMLPQPAGTADLTKWIKWDAPTLN